MTALDGTSGFVVTADAGLAIAARASELADLAGLKDALEAPSGACRHAVSEITDARYRSNAYPRARWNSIRPEEENIFHIAAAMQDVVSDGGILRRAV